MGRASTTPAILLALLLALPAPGAAQADAPRDDPAWHGGIAVGSL